MKIDLHAFAREYEKPIAVCVSIAIAFFLMISLTYFEAMENIGTWCNESGALYAFCTSLEMMPPYASLIVLPFIPFAYMTRHPFAKRQVSIVVVSAIISACIVTSQSLVHTHTYGTLFASPLNGLLSIVAFLDITAFVFCLLRAAFYAIVDRKGAVATMQGVSSSQRKTFQLSLKHLGIIFAIFIICWLPYIIIFSPGFINIDGMRQLAQWEGVLDRTTSAPIVSTIIYGSIFSAGSSIGGDQLGLFFLVIMQTLLTALAFTFETEVMSRLRAPRWVIIVFVALIALSPTIATFCSFVAMDNLHAAFFSLYVSLMILYVKDPKTFSHSIPWMAALLLCAMMAGFTRHNAFFAIMFSLPFLALFHPGVQAKLKALAPLLAAIVLIPCINQLGAMGTQSETTAGIGSMFSLPLQQTARYAAEHPDDYTEWEYQVIDDYLQMEDLADRYEFYLMDPVGEMASSEVSRSDYLKVWFQQGLRHPLTYMDALGEMTYGWWSVQTHVPYELEGNRIGQANLTHKDTGEQYFDFGYWHSYQTRTEMNRFTDMLERMPFFNFFIQGGFYTWLLIILAAFLIFAKRPRYMIILIPSLVILVTLFFGPRENTLRYFLDVVYAMPVILWASLSISRDQ